MGSTERGLGIHNHTPKFLLRHRAEDEHKSEQKTITNQNRRRTQIRTEDEHKSEQKTNTNQGTQHARKRFAGQGRSVYQLVCE